MSQQETAICPLCQGNEPKVLVRHWKDYRLYDCPRCQIGFCVPFKNPGSEYYAHFKSAYPHQAQETTDSMSEEYDEALDFLRRQRLQGPSLLDVGCGNGGFISRVRKEGFQVSGLDFNEARLKLIRSQLGIEKIYCGSLEDFVRSCPAEHFDVVTMFQVLEHLDNPHRWLDLAHSVLNPEGYFIIGVPNRNRTFDPFQGPGMEEMDNPPHHLTRWSAKALKNILEQHSFKVVEIKSLGVPLPLLALLIRNHLRLGIATKVLNVGQMQHAASKTVQSRPVKAAVIQWLVACKEKMLNAAAWSLYPAFLVAFKLGRWQGNVLYCVAQRKED